MTIRIEAISFNHDPNSAITDALTIRTNQVDDISVPEWRSGMSLPQDSPAAYTMAQIGSNGLTIKVELRRDSSDPTSVVVKADANSGDVLGNVVPRRINFGPSLTASALFNIQSSVVPPVGVSDITWNWFAEGIPFQTTRHRIYTLVSAPQPPWGQPGSTFADFQVPWIEVLDHACRQAAGATTVDEVADRLTRWVYSLGGSKLQYAEGAGDSYFTISGMKTFRCTRFLEHLSEAGPRARVNCTDCATIVASFANILGCNLYQSRIGYEFQTNLIQKIGLTYPYRQPFKFHEVAWKFPSNGDGDAYVYDSCLEFDGDRNLADDQFLAALGVNIPMGVPARDGGYHFRLIAPTPAGRAAAEQQFTRVRRKIDGQTATRVTTDPEQQRRLAEEYDFPSWQGVPTPEPNPNPEQRCGCKSEYGEKVTSFQTAAAQEQLPSEQQLLVLNYSSKHDQFSPAGWELRKIEEFKAEPDPIKLTDAIWSSTGCSAAELRVLTYECSSISAARLFVLTLLGEFEKPGIKRRREFIVGKKPVEIGDVAFADVDEMVLLFARANTVLLIQNTGRTLVPVSQFAHEIDGEITSKPEPEKGDFPEMKQFFPTAKKMRVGDETPLHCRGGSVTNEKETLFKFLAPSGQVFLRGDELLYRPLVAGEQFITITATKARQTARQVLQFSVEQSMSVQETGCKKLDKGYKEEESVMPNVLGSWSSIRPTNDGASSADMRVDGFLHLNSHNPNSGEVRGRYADIGRRTIEDVTGSVTHVAPNSFRLVLRHAMGDGITRQYEGQLAAIDDGDYGVQLVVGRYSDSQDTYAASDSLVALDAQDNGIWVATKP